MFAAKRFFSLFYLNCISQAKIGLAIDFHFVFARNCIRVELFKVNTLYFIKIFIFDLYLKLMVLVPSADQKVVMIQHIRNIYVVFGSREDLSACHEVEDNCYWNRL